MGLGERLLRRMRVFARTGITKEDFEVVVEYERRTGKAWVDVYLGPDVRRLFEMLDEYGFEGDWDCGLWRGYEMSRDKVRKLVDELKAKGYKVKYKEF
jgi:N-acetyl-anhydromuramyl-L-alanine amidase AmpD